MATIFRAPVFQGQHRRQLSALSPVPALITTTLAIVAAVLPFNNAEAFPRQVQHPSHRLSLNADTSSGTPKTLTPDASLPAFNPPYCAPQHPKRAGQLNGDTSESIPKTLYGDSVQPFFNAPPPVLDRRRPVVDTSAGSPLALLNPAVVAAPFIPGPTALAPIWRRALNADTSLEMPKTLYDDDVIAVFDGPHYAPQHKSKIGFLNADTSQGVPLAILAAIPNAPPFSNPPHFSPDRRRHPGADTSHGMPKTLYADSVKPFFNPPHTPPDRPRPVYDTSHGVSPLVLTFIPPKPFSQNDWPAPVEYRFKQQRTWDVQEYIERIPYRPIVNNTTVAYFPARMWGAGESVGVAPTTNQANLKTWLPHISVPVAEADGRMNVQWWRFFNYLANTKVGGPEAPTIPDIATSVATAQTQAADASTTASAVQQVVVNNAEALSATREVLQDNDVPGSEQIPRVKRFLLDE